MIPRITVAQAALSDEDSQYLRYLRGCVLDVRVLARHPRRRVNRQQVAWVCVWPKVTDPDGHVWTPTCMVQARRDVGDLRSGTNNELPIAVIKLERRS